MAVAEIRLEGVSKVFDKTVAVDGVDLHIADGEFMVLLGPSGCGKTTLLRVLASLIEPDAGAVLITSSIFVSVPRDLEEAARTLGCTPLTAFVKVVLPLALPGLAAAAIFTFVLSWNEVFAAVILTLRQRTLPALVLAALNTSPLPFRFAAAWFMLAPSLVVIFVIRRYLLGLWGRVAR